ncbi:MAG: hypothetical protein HY658_07310 [Actinobacteria bacterium]|nr:hypothetical protein [Actinomycetota bacterium]
MKIRAGVLIGLVALSGCARVGSEEPPGQEATATPSPRDLSEIRSPEMFAAGPSQDLGGELVVPDFCKPHSAGLSRLDADPDDDGDGVEGFFLVVSMEEDVPSLDRPPAIDHGVLLYNIEVRVGVFAPEVRPRLGGGYLYIRQYQTPDRPKLEVNELGRGKAEPVELVDDDIEGDEIRVALPDVGPDTDRVTQWAARVTCVLHHPVEGFYFPSARIPAVAPDKLPVSRA